MSTRNIIKTLIGVGLFILFLFLIWEVRQILAYVLISAVLSIIGRPIVELLRKIKIKKFQLPKSICAVITLAFMIFVITMFVRIFVPQIIEEAQNLSRVDMDQINTSLQEPIANVTSVIQKYQLSEDPDLDANELIQDRVRSIFSVTKVTDILNNIVGTVSNAFVALFSIIFLTFFFLKDSFLLYDFVIAATPEQYREQVISVMEKAKKVLTRYFVGILFQVTLITTLITIGLSILEVKNALLIGFFAGIINIIPYIGPLIGAAFGLIITTSSNIQLDYSTELLPLLGYVAIVFLAVQLLDNLVFQPFIFSNSARIHPVEVFLVIMIAGSLAGIVAMIVAIPTYAFLRIIASEFLSEFTVIRNFTKGVG
ncbi:MAG: AI-2E family transporter [Bacteroidia bacterium]|nr:AI-2E family transporter [Bacteroidia bacterium]NNM16586.1 AI-2E family transporter [Bacteroidia bacterium]